jgi:transcriptional regulator with XRE-family HTH domain
VEFHVDASTVESPDHVNPVLIRQEVGRRLRCAREEVDLNLLEAAARLDVGASTVSRIETGRTQVSTALLEAMIQLYQLDYDEELPDLARRSRRPGWWKQYGFSDQHFIALESAASWLGTFETDLVPGLLQTADYARTLFQAGMRTRTKVWVEHQLDARMIRQERLVADEFPLRMEAVISEFALYRPIGGREVMRAQLRHLALVTELPTVQVRVLPTTVVSTPAMSGAFVMLDFPSIQPSMVYLEHALGQERTEKTEQVAKTKLRFSHLRSLAMDPDDSVALIERVAATMWAE